MNNKEQQKLQAKWERILTKRGLGIYQPMTDNSEGEMADAPTTRTKKDAVSADYAKLRNQMDGSDNFMEAHQIMKVRSMEREVPEWAMSDKEVQRILLTAFPKLKGGGKHATRAGRWARIIYLYYRMKQPRQIVAKELGMKDSTLKTTLRNIERAAKGLTVMGTPRRHPSHTLSRDPERKDESI